MGKQEDICMNCVYTEKDCEHCQDVLAYSNGSRWKWFMIVPFAVLLVIVYVHASNRSNGIYPVGKNAVLISGEVITINWNATDVEADAALTAWRQLRSTK